ncbi:MAG: hypothetical protein M1839_006115, partial [Geoglossum umbratile]
MSGGRRSRSTPLVEWRTHFAKRLSPRAACNRCNTCSKLYSNYSSFISHQYRKLPEPCRRSKPRTQQEFKCSTCSKLYSNYNSFSSHRYRKHRKTHDAINGGRRDGEKHEIEYTDANDNNLAVDSTDSEGDEMFNARLDILLEITDGVISNLDSTVGAGGEESEKNTVITTPFVRVAEDGEEREREHMDAVDCTGSEEDEVFNARFDIVT